MELDEFSVVIVCLGQNYRLGRMLFLLHRRVGGPRFIKHCLESAFRCRQILNILQHMAGTFEGLTIVPIVSMDVA